MTSRGPGTDGADPPSAAGERDRDLERASRRLSYVLRHDPASVGLTLDAGGWVEVDQLLAGLGRTGHGMTRAVLDQVVATSDKQRFALDGTGSRIRANQGHSVSVDLGLVAQQPPDVLFHGTVRSALDRILAAGLDRRSRHHVHLSADRATATRVGARRGRPVLLAVDAAAMVEAGHEFYLTQNAVWLTAAVPPEYLTVLV